ncbi:MAG: hypothetical protein NTW19_24025 [Planctomycetota bacterium]|nr:hypothetical protein [Planctomycetota bacterium]
MDTAQHRDWLLEITSLPTASGREDRVEAWVRRWAKRHPSIEILADASGNLTVQRRGAASANPIYFTAHMDHPAFVVTELLDARRVRAEFRGTVHEKYFAGAAVVLYHADLPAQPGKVVDFDNRPDKDNFGGNDSDKYLVIAFERDVVAAAGDVLTWDVGQARIEGDRLFTPACDDLAGLAAAISAYDTLLADPAQDGVDVRLLLTRAEEFGFIGAIAAMKHGTVPRGARVIALENSKSFPESPIGGGPIVRVGDFTSTFDPGLTYRVGKIAQQVAAEDASFRFQRKLMAGGTCEASVYQSYGHTATCICLPLGNYHNMNEPEGRIEAETISVNDYHGLVRLLVQVARWLDDAKKAPDLRERFDGLYERRKRVLG